MMGYYKHNNGQVYFYDSESDASIFGPVGLVEMTDDEIFNHLNPQIEELVPLMVTMRQARLALHAAGLLVQVETAIDALPEPPRSEARIEWDYASEVHRGSEFVTLLGAALELDKQSLDDLFLKASEL